MLLVLTEMSAAELYRLHLSAPPQQLLRELQERASSFPADFQFSVKHSLSFEQESQLDILVSSSRGKKHLQSIQGIESSSRSLEHSALVAALFGWTVPTSSSARIQSSPSLSSTPGSSTSIIVQCKLCARRLAVKGKTRPPNTDADQIPPESERTSDASPDKLSSVDVASAHRRFCPYIAPISDATSQTLGYAALLERISPVEHHLEQPAIVFEPTPTDRSKSNVVHVSIHRQPSAETMLIVRSFTSHSDSRSPSIREEFA